MPPTGRHKTIIQYSDDDGRTWEESESKLISPCYAGFNGSNEGACEPAIEQLRDGRICLNDRMFDPANDLGEEFAVFRTDLDADGRVGDIVLEPGTWHEITLKWNLEVPECRLLVDGKNAGVLDVRHQTLNGVSYVRFRSAARELDTAGFLVDSVKVSIDDPYAPQCGREDQIEQGKRYVENVVPRWSKE